jgi:crossover junction endodeoxyribonuclease RusA
MLKFRVYGVPAPQGSKNARVGKDGRAHMYEQSKKLKPWREEVSDVAAREVDGRDPLDGPLFVDLLFFMKRPAKPKFKDFPAVMPDLDKISRSVYDALKMGGAIKDDARIVVGHGRKVFADTPEDQGCRIVVMPIDEWLALDR